MTSRHRGEEAPARHRAEVTIAHRGTRAGSHRRARSARHDPAGPRRTALRRTAFGAAGLLCLLLGASVALSSRQTPVVRIEASAHQPGGIAPTDPQRPTEAGPATGQAGTAGTAPAGAPRPFAASPPTRLRVPAAGVDAPVTGLGLNADGTVEVPAADRAQEVGWYRNGPTPGETGPAVLIGHYDTAHGPAVFRGLPKLQPGDRIQVVRADGSTVDFKVRSLLQAAKDRFPTGAVYGDTAAPELRLITCGGRIGADGHWTDNIIVLADLATPTG
ncbi:class F sortase [Kitasatospora sp. A2-31]|uniref:class F sortase n=1 Tax=Kitasatospora sp. A2-31 TaxID=2916414 RepID=UPI001EEB6D8F|nr:class F sortase [Kitasatospora sp. A2-31]MCG6494737.1 class F sortase [Kitasatospora sp. A2-31]